MKSKEEFLKYLDENTTQGNWVEENGMKKRQLILYLSLNFEMAVSTALCALLDIEYKDSVSFGGTNRALSFEAKITLLKDLKVLTKDEKIKLGHFASIRNKFMHQLRTNTYEKCVNQIEGLLTFLKREYPFKDEKTLEENLESAIYGLGTDCGFITMRGFEMLFVKGVKKNLDDSMNNLYKAHFQAFQDLSKKAKSTEKNGLISIDEFEEVAEIWLKQYQQEQKDNIPPFNSHPKD